MTISLASEFVVLRLHLSSRMLHNMHKALGLVLSTVGVGMGNRAR